MICQLFEMKRFFLFIGNLAFIVENVSTLDGLWRVAALQNKLIAGGVNCSGQIISLRRFDKVSDEIKPHITFKI